jgi:Leu/Phe-tRNA-protein transferase
MSNLRKAIGLLTRASVLGELTTPQRLQHIKSAQHILHKELERQIQIEDALKRVMKLSTEARESTLLSDAINRVFLQIYWTAKAQIIETEQDDPLKSWRQIGAW